MKRPGASWSSLTIFLLITAGVLLYTKMLKETEKTIDFVVIIFIIVGISVGVAPTSPPGYFIDFFFFRKIAIFVVFKKD